MKRNLLIFFIFFSVSAYSQTISYGLSAGLNYTNIPGDRRLNNSLTNGFIAGFQAGGLIDIGFKAFSIQPGILFTTTGGQGKLNGTIDGVAHYLNTKVELDYVRIPINVIYKINAGSGSLFIGGGPYVGFLMSAKISYVTDLSPDLTAFLWHGSDTKDIKNPDLGITALLGYKLNLGLGISASYSLGAKTTYNTGANNKNTGFNISVSYFF